MTSSSLRFITPQYLAGLFDGEGCVDVQRMYPQTGGFYVRPRVRMHMTMSSWYLGEELHNLFGGNLNVNRKRSTPNASQSWALEWLSGDDIRRIWMTIGSYLVLKREQMALAVWWLDNASGRQIKEATFPGMHQARVALVEELRAMKADPQRLSGEAAERIVLLMRQSEHGGNVVTLPETRKALG